MNLIDHLTIEQAEELIQLDTPYKIQLFLDQVPYIGEELNRSPLRVFQDRQAHCLDGAMFAAAALQRLGYPPLILDLVNEPGIDEDHVLALFKRNGCWGAVAKSNFAGLRYREPVYQTLRELVMSYFHHYFNIDGIRSLRAYTMPFHLSQFERIHWQTDQAATDQVVEKFYRLPAKPLLSPKSIEELFPVDPITFRTDTAITNTHEVFHPNH